MTKDRKFIGSLFNTITVSDIMLKSAVSIENEKVRNSYTKHKAMATVALFEEYGIEIYGLELARKKFDITEPAYEEFLSNLDYEGDKSYS